MEIPIPTVTVPRMTAVSTRMSAGRGSWKRSWGKIISYSRKAYLAAPPALTIRSTRDLSGLDYIYPCLMSHEPVDLLIIMLGTNDTKERFGASAACIALGLKRLIAKAISTTDCWRDKRPNILVVVPKTSKRVRSHSGRRHHGPWLCRKIRKALPKSTKRSQS